MKNANESIACMGSDLFLVSLCGSHDFLNSNMKTSCTLLLHCCVFRIHLIWYVYANWIRIIYIYFFLGWFYHLLTCSYNACALHQNFWSFWSTKRAKTSSLILGLCIARCWFHWFSCDLPHSVCVCMHIKASTHILLSWLLLPFNLCMHA